MALQIILLLAVGILLYLLFLKITKAVIKAIAATFLVLILLFGIMGFIIYKDIKEGKYTLKEKIFGILGLKTALEGISEQSTTITKNCFPEEIRSSDF